MAAGRRGGFRDQELRVREFEIEVSRKKELYQEREPGRSSREWRGKDSSSSRVRSKESKERESVNGSRRTSSSNSNSSGGGGNRSDRIRKGSSSARSVDREPGELSSGSGSDDDSRELKGKDNRIQKLANGVSSSSSPMMRKRKFSPIVWDREDPRKKSMSPVGSKATAAAVNVPLPPPPPLPEGFVPSKTVEPSGEPQEDDEVDIGHADGDDEEFVPARNISASRWADGDDDDNEDDEGISIGGDGGSQRKKDTPRDSSMASKLNKKVPTPELGEVLARDRSGEAGSRSSGSSSEDRGSSPEFEVNKKNYMDVDDEDTGHESGDQHSVEGSDIGDDKVLEPVQPPQRDINMLQGCRSVDEFERLNKIDEGTYGVVYRARDKKTGEVVALKKVKMEKEREGFPMTSLREINILLSFHHPSIVDVKEVVVGSSLDSIFMVMEYMEHDLKGLMESMKQPFSQSEVKCLMLQLLEGVKYLHDNWVLHRDLKTSNLLFNNRGELKICDFGLSRQYGSPLKPYTHLVVTLWYRAPELLLGMKEYSTAIDMWSLGCIMAELLAKEPLFNGKTEFDQLDKKTLKKRTRGFGSMLCIHMCSCRAGDVESASGVILTSSYYRSNLLDAHIFRILGTPNEKIWPGFSKLPGVKVNFVKQPYNKLREKFPPTSFSGRPTLSEKGFDLLNKLLTYDPEKRITADAALKHEWFKEVPLPKSKDFMPTFPAQHAQDRRLRRVFKSPDPLEEQRRKELQQGEIGAGTLFG